MPKRTPKTCGKQGCRKYASDGYYCEDHQPVREDSRLPASQRGYDRRWSKFRHVYLRQHPVCNRCGVAAKIAHHINPIDEGGPQYDEMNLEPLCWVCHERHHGRVR